MNRRSLKKITLLILSAVMPLASCVQDSNRPERLYTVYVNLTPKPKATPTPLPTPRPPKPKPKPSPTPAVNALKQKVQTRFANLIKIMNDRGIIERDIPRGESRLKRIRELMSVGDFKTTETLLTSFYGDLKSIRIDEAFITKKNDRLLELIQTSQPTAEVQKKIDEESEAINQLLEKEDYISINRRMNRLFRILQ